MKTLVAIHGELSDDLIACTANVMLKERRCLVLVARETPLSGMLEVSRRAAIIFLLAPAYDIRLVSVDELIDQSVGRILDLFDLDTRDFTRWQDWG